MTKPRTYLVPQTGTRSHIAYGTPTSRISVTSLCGRTRDWAATIPQGDPGTPEWRGGADWPLCSICERIREWQDARA